MNRFGFLIHPLGMRDVVRHLPNVAGKRPPLVEKVLEWTPSYHASHIHGIRSVLDGREVEGDFFTVPLFPHQILNLDRQFVLGRVLEACRLAEEQGARIIGLGGYTSVVGSAGRTVADTIEAAVTSGNSYTVATAIEGARAAAQALDIDMTRASVAVVGATGSIGSVCSRILARQGVGRLNLVARSISRLQALAETIRRESPRSAVALDTDIEAGIHDADVIVTCTTSGGGILRPEALKPGCVICDVAVPHDVCREVAQLRPDVLVLEGGVVEAPGDARFNFDFGFPEGICLACMAETMTLALEGRFEDFSIGRGLEIEKVEEIQRLATRHGFRLAGFRAFDEPITTERIEEVRSLARDRRKGLRVISS